MYECFTLIYVSRSNGHAIHKHDFVTRMDNYCPFLSQIQCFFFVFAKQNVLNMRHSDGIFGCAWRRAVHMLMFFVHLSMLMFLLVTPE